MSKLHVETYQSPPKEIPIMSGLRKILAKNHIKGDNATFMVSISLGKGEVNEVSL
jgi:hypothetical protein